MGQAGALLKSQAAKSSLFELTQNRIGYSRKQVEGWHKGPIGSHRRLAHNYLNGNGEFLFPLARRSSRSFSGTGRRRIPNYIAASCSYIHATDRNMGHAWNEPPQLGGHDFSVVCGWDQKFVLINDIEFIEKNKIVVPSRIRLARLERIPNLFGSLVYLSVVKGALDAFVGSRTGKGELDRGLVPFGAMRGYEFPHAVVEGRSEVMDCIADDKREIGYRGFVTLGSDGAFSSFVIGFESVAERTAFLDEFIGVEDVLLGPINL